MNREIKYRAKVKMPERLIARKHEVPEGQWVHGEPHTIDCPTPHIHTVDVGKQPIDKETIGQFTGFYDRKRLEIYEGDIITYLNHRIDGTGFIEQGKVEWRQKEGCYVFVNKFPTKDNRELVMPLIHCKEITVIGNIHDNPELLKGGKDVL